VGTSSAAKAIDQKTAPERSAARPAPGWADLAAVALYLMFFSWLLFAWTPLHVQLLSLPVLAVLACMGLAGRNPLYRET